MKKVVAVVLVIVMVLMSGVFVWGFLEKQNNEKESNNVPANKTTNSIDSKETTPAQTKTSSITNSELSKHNKSNDCWLAISGNVYDVTSYLGRHPGGADLIMMYCGKDATAAYNNQGGQGRHSSRADSIRDSFLIGELN